MDDTHRKIRILKESIEGDKAWQAKAGISGYFQCQSCNQSKPLVGSYREEGTGISLCSDCFYQWGELKIEGKVSCFADIVPADHLTA